MSIRNNWKIAISSLKSNKKSLLLTTIGLTIALSVSFQMILFLIGSKGALLETFLTGQYDKGLFGGIISDESIAIDIGPDFEGVLYEEGYPSNNYSLEVKNDLRTLTTNFGYKDFITSSRVCSVTDITLYYQKTLGGEEYSSGVTLIGLSQEDLDFMRYISPIGFPEVNGTHHLIIYTQSHLSNDIYIPTDYKFDISSSLVPGRHEITLAGGTILDFWAIRDAYRSIYNQFLRRFGYSLVQVPRILMVTSLDGVGELMDDMNVEETVNCKYYVNIDIDYTQFGVFSEQRDYNKNTIFEQKLQISALPTSNNFFTFIYNRINHNMRLFYDDFNYIQTIILVLTFPPIAIAFFMINFSFNIVRSQNIHHINLLKVRGATKWQVFLALLFEMGISTTIALIVGALLGIPLLQLIGKTSGFMRFNSDLPIADYGFSAIGAMILIILVSGIFLSLVINLPRIIRLSRLQVRNVAGEEERKRKPVWERLHFDVIISIYALISLVMYLIAVSYTEGDVQTTLVLIFGVSCPVSIVVATSMLISRYFTPFIRNLGNGLWIKRGGTFALSLKNLTHQKKQTSRAVILIIITMSFGIVSAVVPSTIDYNTHQRWDYVIGADVTISGGGFYQEEMMEYVNTFPEVEATTNVILQNEGLLPIGMDITTTTIIGINTDTFLDAAFMQPLRYGFSSPIKTLVSRLDRTGNILVQKDNLRNAHMSIGSNFYSDSHYYEVVGKFKYFPNLVKDRQYSTSVSTQKYIVGSIRTVQNLLSDYGSLAYLNLVYIKQVKPNMGETIKSKILDMYPEVVVTVTETGANNNLEMPARLSTYAMLNSSFLTTMISTIAGISIYSLLILFDRSKELAITRALGAKNREIYKSFMYETLLIMGIGMGIGLPLGIGVSAIVSNIINSRNEVPPLTISVPWLALLIILVLTLLIASISATIPAYYITKKEINDLSRTT